MAKATHTPANAPASSPASEAALRGLGLVLTLVFLLTYDPSAGAVIQAIALLALASGSWLILRSGIAIALAAALVAAAHSDPGAGDLWASQICPAIALASSAFVAGSLAVRFRRHVQRTRDARWAPRSHG